MAFQIAIIGAGVMGETLLAAFLDSGIGVQDIAISEKRAEQAEALRSTHGVSVLDNVEAARQARMVLIAVKPQDMSAVLGEIGPVVPAGSTIISLAAGVTLAAVESAVSVDVAAIRVMPNTPALVGAGMFAMSPGSHCSAEQLAAAKDLLESSGKVAIVPEGQQDAVTGLSGSGPAYVFYLAESMIAGGIEAGLPADTARLLAIQTIVGAAAMLDGSEVSPSELRKRVTSAGGTTAAAIAALDLREVRASIVAAIAAASRRSSELSQ